MSINETLCEAMHQQIFSKYNLPEDEIKEFLTRQECFKKRQMSASSIVKNIMIGHEKEMLHNTITELARIEHGTTKIEKMGRDHVIHTVLSFILGGYINEKLFFIKNLRVDEFQWKLSGLFHDIGYPAQIAIKIFTDYFKKFSSIKTNICDSHTITYMEFTLNDFSKLHNNISSFDLITNKLKSWGINIDSEEVYEDCFKEAKVNHGIISALSVLSIIDELYQKNNPQRVI